MHCCTGFVGSPISLLWLQRACTNLQVAKQARAMRDAPDLDTRLALVLHDHEAGLREFEHAVFAVVAAQARALPASVEASMPLATFIAVR
jgi:phosphatidylethanolamine-binding protein (PEBP) family uncharacterized protein